MKRILFTAMVTITLFFTNTQVNAQAWEKSTKVLALGFGASQFYHIDNYYNDPYWGYRRGWYSPITGQLNFQGEFGVHEYVGVGFTTGFGGGGGWGRYYNGSINIPIGVIANFHFYQLIADKTGKDIHADKLDIYAGLSLGSGVAFILDRNNNHIAPIAFGGPHAGIRYYFAPKVGVNAEVGFGKHLASAGFVFKL